MAACRSPDHDPAYDGRRSQRKKAAAKRVVRGGSWIDNARNCRSANRNANHPGKRNHNMGLRLARALSEQGHQEAQRCDRSGAAACRRYRQSKPAPARK